MSIESYFNQIRQIIDNMPEIVLSNVTYSNQGEEIGYLRGDLTFSNGSLFHFREYVDAEFEPDRLMYSYHYMDSANTLIFRYDDVDHHSKLNLPNHPHHKHDSSEENIVASAAPTLADVLDEIGLLLRLE